MDLDNGSNQLVSELSSGNRQKLKLAITLSREKKYYIFDEPTNFLDKQSIINFANLLKNNMINGAVIIASNDNFFCNLLSDFTEDLIGEFI